MDLYERYKLEWMIEHGYSLTDLFKSIGKALDAPDLVDAFEEWEDCFGFVPEMWANKKAWQSGETNAQF